MLMLFRKLLALAAGRRKSSDDIVRDQPSATPAPDDPVLGACEVVRLAAQKGDLERARTLMAQLCAEHPDSPHVRLCEINLLWFLDEHPHAYEKCVAELARRPSDTGLMLLCGQFAQAMGRHNEVIELCNRAIDLGVTDPAVFSAIASSFLQIGSPQQAHDYFERAVHSDPDNPVFLQNLGYAKAAFGLLEAATSLLERAVTLDPNLAEARMNLANVQRRSGRSADAMQTIRSALDLDPENSRYLAEYAACLTEACKWEELIDIRRRILEVTQRELRTGTKPGSPPLLAIILGFSPELQLEVARAFHD